MSDGSRKHLAKNSPYLADLYRFVGFYWIYPTNRFMYGDIVYVPAGFTNRSKVGRTTIHELMGRFYDVRCAPLPHTQSVRLFFGWADTIGENLRTRMQLSLKRVEDLRGTGSAKIKKPNQECDSRKTGSYPQTIPREGFIRAGRCPWRLKPIVCVWTVVNNRFSSVVKRPKPKRRTAIARASRW